MLLHARHWILQICCHGFAHNELAMERLDLQLSSWESWSQKNSLEVPQPGQSRAHCLLFRTSIWNLAQTPKASAPSTKAASPTPGSVCTTSCTYTALPPHTERCQHVFHNCWRNGLINPLIRCLINLYFSNDVIHTLIDCKTWKNNKGRKQRKKNVANIYVLDTVWPLCIHQKLIRKISEREPCTGAAPEAPTPTWRESSTSLLW